MQYCFSVFVALTCKRTTTTERKKRVVCIGYKKENIKNEIRPFEVLVIREYY